MARIEQIRAAIVAEMQAVPDIGTVHPYERYTVAERDFAALYTNALGLRGWFVRRTATRETIYSHTRTRVETDWQIRGFIGLRDALQSEIVADGLIEEVRNRFRINQSLGGLLDAPMSNGQAIGAQLVEFAPYKFAGALCHGIMLTLATAHLQADVAEPAGLADFRIFHPNWDFAPRGAVPEALPADGVADATDHVVLPV